MSISIIIPDDVENRLRGFVPDLERYALEGFVVEAYRQKKIGTHIAGMLLGLPSRWDTIEFLSERGVYPNYDVADLELDLKNLENLRKK